MTTIATEFKGRVKLDVHHFANSRFELHVKHTKGWKPFIVVTAGDFMKLFNKRRKVK